MNSWPGYEVLSYNNSEQRQKWRAICQSFQEIDIQFYPEYTYLFELNGDGQATCFVYYESADDLVFYPFLERHINEIAIFRDIPNNVTDIITPYGYGGYLRNNDRVDMEKFYKHFLTYCQQNNIVSEFVRFHPLLNNLSYCPQHINVEQWNETVVIDLTKDNEYLWNTMEPTCRNKIRKAQKHGLMIIEDSEYEYLDDFVQLYQKTMGRLGVLEYYCFSKTWFEHMARLFKENMALFHVIYNDFIIMSAIFLFSRDFIHYHLSGSVYEMRHIPANNLLIYEVALWAKSRGFKEFHLGGGYKPDDNLFRFKASFSPLRRSFYIGKRIHNYEIYQYLTSRRWAAGGPGPDDSHFFPEYRIP